MDHPDKPYFDEVSAFARQAAVATGEVPLSTIQHALDYADGELGRRMLLHPDQRPPGTDVLMQDVRFIRAMQRYRLALDGIAPTSTGLS